MAVRLPEGWADVARKEDLRNLEETLILRMDALESRIHQRILRTALNANIPTIFAAFALAFTAVRLG